jgi:hypothetical protein
MTSAGVVLASSQSSVLGRLRVGLRHTGRQQAFQQSQLQRALRHSPTSFRLAPRGTRLASGASNCIAQPISEVQRAQTRDSPREVDGGERNVSRETRRRSTVETQQTQLLDDVHSTLGRTGRTRRCLSLHLKSDLDNLQRIREDLESTRQYASTQERVLHSQLGILQQFHQPAAPREQ